MFWMYIIKSTVDDNLYFGSTSDLDRRLEEHNAGLVRSTKTRRPFTLVYCEGYANEHDARKREHNLKLRAQALTQLLLRIRKSIQAT